MISLRLMQNMKFESKLIGIYKLDKHTGTTRKKLDWEIKQENDYYDWWLPKVMYKKKNKYKIKG